MASQIYDSPYRQACVGLFLAAYLSLVTMCFSVHILHRLLITLPILLALLPWHALAAAHKRAIVRARPSMPLACMMALQHLKSWLWQVDPRLHDMQRQLG